MKDLSVKYVNTSILDYFIIYLQIVLVIVDIYLVFLSPRNLGKACPLYVSLTSFHLE